VERQRHGAGADDRSVLECRAPVDAAPVDERAVATPQVFNGCLILLYPDDRVPPRDRRMVDIHLGARLASDQVLPFAEGELASRVPNDELRKDRTNGSRVPTDVLHGRDEPVPLANHRLDEPGTAWVIAKRLPQLSDCRIDRGFLIDENLGAPEGCLDFRATDQCTACVDQLRQQLHGDSLEPHTLPAAPERISGEVKLELPEPQADGHPVRIITPGVQTMFRKCSSAVDGIRFEERLKWGHQAKGGHMFRSNSSSIIVIAVAVLAAACSQRGNGPTAPSASASAAIDVNARGGMRWVLAEHPPFNLEVVLRGEGFGLVKFRQQKDPAQSIVTLGTSVRDLQPNTSYSLQRATDTALDGVCANTSGWLTLGEGLTPHPIVTDDGGTGQADLWRDLSGFAAGSAFDIDFRIMDNATGAIVLQSECYRFVVRD